MFELLTSTEFDVLPPQDYEIRCKYNEKNWQIQQFLLLFSLFPVYSLLFMKVRSKLITLDLN